MSVGGTVVITGTKRNLGLMPSDANICRALYHNTVFMSVTYDPQTMHCKQIGNRKQTFWKNKVH